MLSLVSFAVGVEIHIARCAAGGLLAKIDERGAAVGEAHQHESAAADIAGGGMRHGEREAHRDRGVDGVAAGLEHCDADIGRRGSCATTIACCPWTGWRASKCQPRELRRERRETA